MNYDDSHIDDSVPALLATFSFEQGRAWKGFDFSVMNRLHEQGLISDPAEKAKSVYLSPEGLERGLMLAELLFKKAGED